MLSSLRMGVCGFGFARIEENLGSEREKVQGGRCGTAFPLGKGNEMRLRAKFHPCEDVGFEGATEHERSRS